MHAKAVSFQLCIFFFFTMMQLHWTGAKVHIGQCPMCHSPFAAAAQCNVNSCHLGQVFASEPGGPEFESCRIRVEA